MLMRAALMVLILAGLSTSVGQTQRAEVGFMHCFNAIL
jgi:hypothetical protein